MNILAIHNAIRKRVRTEVQENLKTIVFYDNQPEANPPADLEAFVLANIRPTNNWKMEVGVNSNYRQEGLLIMMIMCEGGKGDKAALTLAAAIVDLFKSQTHDGVTYRTPSPEVVGINPNGWWQVNVNCPFYAESSS